MKRFTQQLGRYWRLEHAQDATGVKCLARFDSADKCKQWKLTTDAEYGGHSYATFEHKNGVGVFEGHLDLSTKGSNMKRSGFCAITSPEFYPPIDLTAYQCLRFRIRTNGSVFISNLKLESRNPDDLFQCFMLPESRRRTGVATEFVKTVSPHTTPGGAVAPRYDPTQFHNIDLLFTDYALTWRGFMEDEHVKAYPNEVVSLGFLMAQRQTGPFRLEIESIEAVSPEEFAKQRRFEM